MRTSIHPFIALRRWMDGVCLDAVYASLQAEPPIQMFIEDWSLGNRKELSKAIFHFIKANRSAPHLLTN